MNQKNRALALQLNLEGLSSVEISSRLGLTRQRVHQLLSLPREFYDQVAGKAGGRCERCGIRVAQRGHIHSENTESEITGYKGEGPLSFLCLSCARIAHQEIRKELDPDIGNNLPTGHNLENCIADEKSLRILEDIVQNLPLQDAAHNNDFVICVLRFFAQRAERIKRRQCTSLRQFAEFVPQESIDKLR